MKIVCFRSKKIYRRTKVHEYILAKEQGSLDITKLSCSQIKIKERNRLSADCVGASGVDMFANKLDIYLRRAGYT